MRRDVSGVLVWLYGAALVLMAATVLALLGALPGVERMQVSGLTQGQAIGLTLALMVLIGLRLVLHIRARRPAGDPPPPAPSDD